MRSSFLYVSTLMLCIYAQAFSLTEAQEFLENNAIYVKNIEEDHVYLKNEYLNISEDKIYIIDQFGISIPLTELFFDAQGIYTKMESFGASVATVYPIVWCKTCNAWRTVNIKGLCSKCGNPP